MLNFIYRVKKKINFRIWLSIKKTHRYFLREKKISLVREIKSDFYNKNIDLKIENYSNYIFSNNEQLNKKIIKQYIGQFLSNNKFFYLFYFFYKKNFSGIYCLPTPYLKYFQKNYNIKINFFLSKIFFFSYVFKEFLKGTNFMIMIFFKILKNRNKNSFFLHEPHDVIFNFSCKNFNIKKNQFDLEQYNIVNWLIKNNSCKKIILQGDDDFSYESGEIKILSNKSIIDNVIVGLKNYKIFFTFLFFYFSTLKNLILFNWWNVVLFKDALEALCFKFSNVKFADNYYTIFTSNIYKPLWTYVVEKEKSKVELLTISSLTDLEHVDKGLKFDSEGIRMSTWNIITVWNEQSKKYITDRDNSKKDNIKVLNSHIFYKDKKQKLDLPNFSVSAFTYENHRFNLTNSFLSDWIQSYSTDLFYINKKFWNDLLLMKEKYDFTLVVKKKRDFPNKFDYKRNLKFNKWLKSQHNVIEVDNNFAIEKIIHNSDVSISMPFTSPSIIANLLNKRSIYYDPTSLININDPNSSGVEIISGKDNLDKFFKNYLERKM